MAGDTSSERDLIRTHEEGELYRDKLTAHTRQLLRSNIRVYFPAVYACFRRTNEEQHSRGGTPIGPRKHGASFPCDVRD